ncbi:hypothetical protein RI367_002296 [Sorochytrium milnesiophthora]
MSPPVPPVLRRSIPITTPSSETAGAASISVVNNNNIAQRTAIIPPRQHTGHSNRFSVPSAQMHRQHQRQPAQAQTPPEQHRQTGSVSQRRQMPPHLQQQFRTKAVCKLSCNHCNSLLCMRGMRAILLADTRVELFSTDAPPNDCVQLVNDDYLTKNCRCRIRDVACLGCGNIVGYHVTQPCDPCLDSCNNGHFWMFHSDGTHAIERQDSAGSGTLVWSNIATVEEDHCALAPSVEVVCR